ncbi:MAG: PQQ-dependent sugar dehydrogenase [Planctomycetota bacterium]
MRRYVQIKWHCVGVLVALIATATTVVGEDSIPALRLVPAYQALKFDRPVDVQFAPGNREHVFAVEQSGRVKVFENRNDVKSASVFLDLKSEVLRSFNEEGLLSLAFHPDYESNGYLYVYYSAAEPRRGVIARFTVSEDDPLKADPSSAKVIFEIEQPWANHNGATIVFGPDGLLYVSLGDGGYANDPLNSGQDLTTLLGAIIRIDVNQKGEGTAYSIPKDNPFVGRADARDEIWAYGLRNVWRMTFDKETGDLWAGDVGQNRWEEVNIITRGGNYGWKLREGFHKFDKGEPDGPLIKPIAEYSHRDGLSVTGGYVYRGSAMPDLVGVYLFADYESRRMWGLRVDDNGEMSEMRVVMEPREGTYVSSFGQDHDGELVVVGFDRPNRGSGRLYRLAIRPE